MEGREHERRKIIAITNGVVCAARQQQLHDRRSITQHLDHERVRARGIRPLLRPDQQLRDLDRGAPRPRPTRAASTQAAAPGPPKPRPRAASPRCRGLPRRALSRVAPVRSRRMGPAATPWRRRHRRPPSSPPPATATVARAVGCAMPIVTPADNGRLHVTVRAAAPRLWRCTSFLARRKAAPSEGRQIDAQLSGGHAAAAMASRDPRCRRRPPRSGRNFARIFPDGIARL